MNFILSELGATGSVDGDNKLVIKGRFQQKQIESVLKGYIREYVTCHTCRSPNTILTKENRLFFLQCEVCMAPSLVQHVSYRALPLAPLLFVARKDIQGSWGLYSAAVFVGSFCMCGAARRASLCVIASLVG
jgi:hypothetical protein